MLREAHIDLLDDGYVATSPAQRHPIFRTPGLEFIPTRFGGTSPASRLLPTPDRLMLWRFRADWHAVSRGDPRSSVSRAEQDRARHYPNSALGKRYLVGRAALRHVLSSLLARPADRIQLADGTDGQPCLLEPHPYRGIIIHVAYAGVWIVIAIGTMRMGIGTVIPTLGSALREYSSLLPRHTAAAGSFPLLVKESADAQERARHDSLSVLTGMQIMEEARVFVAQNGAASIAKTSNGQYCHVLDLPMPGRICTAIALAEPVSTVHAFGWTKN